jgi:O-acetylhomoserine (thiol)-lyase
MAHQWRVLLLKGGKFNWMQNDKFPSLTKEYEGYHGLSFAEEFGPCCFYHESSC